MEIAGLFRLIATRRQQAEWHRARAAATRTDPRTAHELEQAAKQVEKDVEELERHAKSDAELIQNIEMLIGYINSSPIKSAHRTLALRDLESASDRLRRELGSPAA